MLIYDHIKDQKGIARICSKVRSVYAVFEEVNWNAEYRSVDDISGRISIPKFRTYIF